MLWCLWWLLWYQVITLCYYYVKYEFQSVSTLYILPECQGTPSLKQARYPKFKIWLSVRLWTKWLWVRISLLSLMSSNTLQFQYFWDFNKYLQVIFSQLTFPNKSYKSPLKVCELKVWVKQPPDVFQNVKTVQQRKPNFNFIRVIKNSSFNQSFV